MNPGNCFLSDSGKQAIRRDHPHRRIEMKFCTVDGLQEVVLRFEFHQNRSAVLELLGSKFALSRWLGHCLIQNRNLAANEESNSKQTWEIK